MPIRYCHVHRHLIAAGLLCSSALLPLSMAQAQSTESPAASAAVQTAAAPSMADVTAVIELENWAGRMKQLRNGFDTQARNAINAPAWRDKPQAVKDRVREETLTLMNERFAWPGELRPMVIEAYMTELNAAEVAQMRDFYASDEGRWLTSQLQPVMDRLSADFLGQVRQDLNSHSNTWLADGPLPAEPSTLPAPWEASNTHEAAAQQLLNLNRRQVWASQLARNKTSALRRFEKAAGGLTETDARVAGFIQQMRHSMTLDAYLPMLVGQLTQALSEAEIQRAIALETSPTKKQVTEFSQRVGTVFQQRMQVWQRTTVIPGLAAILRRAQPPAQAAPAQ